MPLVNTTARLGLLDGCWDVYLDVGTNIGIQIRKLFEPEAYQAAPVQATFTRYFGADAERRRASVCAVGFEPNPLHGPGLDELERRYASLGWRATILRAAASTTNGEANFRVHDSVAARKRHDWGASLVQRDLPAQSRGDSRSAGAAPKRGGAIGSASTTTTTVATVDIAAWLRREVRGRRLPKAPPWATTTTGSALMKLDIEGAEYAVVPRLLSSGALCLFDVVWIEFHGFLTYPVVGARERLVNRTHAFLEHARATGGPCARTRIEALDDESFGWGPLDAVPWPTGRKPKK